VQHEILHALGFAHEQQRKDRDDYIELHPECIESTALSQYTASTTRFHSARTTSSR
jgi:hypothetical protein